MTQEILTFFIDAIAILYILLLALDFLEVLMNRFKALQTSPGQLNLFDVSPEPFSILPDPWLLPIDTPSEMISMPQPYPQPSKPLLLLPPAKQEVAKALPITIPQANLEELLSSTNLDTLQLRSARRIAKALGIAQKVNGKDRKLNVLRSQIRAKLQQPQSLSPEAIEAVGQLFDS